MKIEKKSHYAIKACEGTKGFSVKSVDEAGRTVCGFGNAYNYLDSGRDVLMPGACKKSIKMRGPKSNASAKIKFALFHDLTKLPARMSVLEEATMDTEFGEISGPYFEAVMSDTEEGDDTLEKYKAGIYDQHSIGYQVLDMEMIERNSHGNSKKWDNAVKNLINPEAADGIDYMFLIHEIELYEISAVAFGMNDLSVFLGVKSGDAPREIKQKINERMDKLNKIISSGTPSDDTKFTIDLQFRQLKQIIDDLELLTNDPRRIIEDKKKSFSLFSIEDVKNYL